MMKMCFTRSVRLGAKKELYERVVVQSVTHGVETVGMRKEERHEIGVVIMKCLDVCAQ